MENETLRSTAKRIITLLEAMPEVQRCTLYGSLADGRWDALSDIDIEVDVSGCDNGLFMLGLPERLKDRLTICYCDYAPSLAPQQYVLSLVIDAGNPFCIADLRCAATPHCTTVTRQQLQRQNDAAAHLLKLWTANCKHFVRGGDCRADICRMAKKLALPGADTRPPQQLLADTLCWLEQNTRPELAGFLAVCRRWFGAAITG